ncbi:hypothetical protein [Methylocella sp.]|uniref:hypothetical protein n=1 Tax=Methylocella sp. TaxID=1978226 RepID=UPI0035B1B4A8
MTAMDQSGDAGLPAPRASAEADAAPAGEGADCGASAEEARPAGALRASRADSLAGEGAAEPARPADAGLSDLLPLFAAGEREEEKPPPGRVSALLNHAASAGFVLAVLGFAFAAGTYFFGQDQGAQRQAAQTAREDAERGEALRRAQAQNAAMASDVAALKANVEALRASLAQPAAGSKDMRSLEKSVDALKVRVDAVKSDVSANLAELGTKVDKMQRDPTLKQVAERLERIEKQAGAATGSIAPMVKAATADQKGGAPKTLAPDAGKRPQLITSWVVRDVYDGVALIENARGSMEVAIGDRIPGAGAVRSIERRGPGWIVVTSQGVIDYDRSLTP